MAAVSGVHGPLRQLAGQVWLEQGELVCEPWSLSAGTLIVPDVDGSTGAQMATTAAAPETSSVPEALARFLAGALHAGGRRRDGAFAKEGQRLASALKIAGFDATADRLQHWLSAPVHSAAAFGALAVWLTVLREG